MEELKVIWDKQTYEKFQEIIGGIPDMIRGIAETRVSKKAESIVRSQNRTEILEKDMVDAFFAETPFGFHGPMKTDMEKVGVDYVKYGHPK
jgi:hypothetical protein